MDAKRLAEIKARCEAACVGPWVYSEDDENHEKTVSAPDAEYEPSPGYEHQKGNNCTVCFTCYDFYGDQERLNLEFIAASRQDVPELVAEVEALQAQNAALCAQLESTGLVVRGVEK